MQSSSSWLLCNPCTIERSKWPLGSSESPRYITYSRTGQNEQPHLTMSTCGFLAVHSVLGSILHHKSPSTKSYSEWNDRFTSCATHCEDNEHNHMHHNVLGDVGIHYSLAVMSHVFPVVKMRENRAVMSKNCRQCTHHSRMCKKWDSPNEVGGRREGQHMTTTTTCVTIC